MTQVYLRRKTKAELARDLAEMLKLKDPDHIAWALHTVPVATLDVLCSSVASSLGLAWRPFR